MTANTDPLSYAIDLAKKGRAEAAIDAFRAIDPSSPQYANAQFNIGVMLSNAAQYQDALTHLENAARTAPDVAAVWQALAQCHAYQDQHEQAVKAYRRLTHIEPENAVAWARLSDSLRFAERLDESVEAAQKAVDLDPGSISHKGALLYAKMKACDWRFIERLRRDVTEAVRQTSPTGTNGLRPFLGVVTLTDPIAQKSIADAYAAKMRAQAPVIPDVTPRDREKITIGYLSAGFRNHPTGHLIASMFAEHDRARFRIVGLSLSPDDGSELRRKIADGCDAMIDLAGLSNQQAARAIQLEKVDILVDLHGYLQGHRAKIVAARPAPVSVNYLGFPGTMGANLHDYIIADDLVAPPEHEGHFGEAVVRLPGGYQVNNSADFQIGPRADRARHGLGDGVIFSCFNMNYKVDPGAFGAWIEILNQVPDSQLWILGGSEEVMTRLRAAAERNGLPRQRLVFGPPLNRHDHLERLTAADIALDPFLCGGHTSTTDCLFAGVPAITRTGKSFAGRVASSLMVNAGLPDCVTPDRASYIDAAVALARDPVRLAQMRRQLHIQGKKQPLFNIVDKVRAFEAAYVEMQRRALAGEPPTPLTVGG